MTRAPAPRRSRERVVTVTPVSRPRERGFTLLEVLIALTICATTLAFLFAAVAGSKDLTFRAQQALLRGDALRQLVTLSLLVDETGELLVLPEESDYQVVVDTEEIEVPERKTDVTTEAVRAYDIENASGDIVLRGVYWITLEEAE